MKIILLGDVHGNLAALEAVLADGWKRGGELVLNTGDYVGQGPYPDETVSLLAATEMLGVKGNFDKNVLRAQAEKNASPKRDLHLWNQKALSKASRKYLERLPRWRKFVLGGKSFFLTHGSPEDREENVTAETPDERLRELAERAGTDFILAGHTHEPLAKKLGAVWFLNPGTVGHPLGEDKRPCYALLTLRPGYFRVHHYRVDCPEVLPSS